MAPYHFELLVPIFEPFRLQRRASAESVDHGAVDAGLKYVNNDICYPSILVTGQIMEAVMSGALRHRQACRAHHADRAAAAAPPTTSPLIRKALKAVGLVAHSCDRHHRSRTWASTTPASTSRRPCCYQAVYALQYGDLLMQCLYRTRPYEVEPGSANRPVRPLDGRRARASCASGESSRPRSSARSSQIVEDFDTLPLAGRGNQAARRRGRRDLGEVPPHGEQPDRRRHRAGRAARPWCRGSSSSSCSAWQAASSRRIRSAVRPKGAFGSARWRPPQVMKASARR